MRPCWSTPVQSRARAREPRDARPQGAGGLNTSACSLSTIRSRFENLQSVSACLSALRLTFPLMPRQKILHCADYLSDSDRAHSRRLLKIPARADLVWRSPSRSRAFLEGVADETRSDDSSPLSREHQKSCDPNLTGGTRNPWRSSNCSTLASCRAHRRPTARRRLRGSSGRQPRCVRFGVGGVAEVPAAEPEPQALSLVNDARASRDWSRALAAVKWVGVVMLSATTAAAAVWEYQRRIAVRASGSVTIQTTPSGQEVMIDGQRAGLTPLTVSLAPASYSFQVGSGAGRRDLAVSVIAGGSVLQHLELPVAAVGAGADRWRPARPDGALGTVGHGRRRRTRAIPDYGQRALGR